ncbi:MFS transporter [Sediminicoccus sp. KRV36]|uniref:MFS transporter n=1 Tax=Sediminicoccus sp. KRV36 TaxID=3133721 RepID=UPI00200CCB70|nr:MFS transporter [Sediminicoccus rosea]UPY36519.1 MFS transporter [Sediminicoccus rosea]
MDDAKFPRVAIPILVGAAIMLGLSMGLRQSLGLFVQPASRDLAIGVSDFTLAIAIQNLIWGVLQPFAGILAVRLGFRAVMVGGAVLYALGMLTLSLAGGAATVMLGAGILVGAGMACTAGGIAMATASRAVSAARRSGVLGMVSAAGSLGALVAAPLGQMLMEQFGWRVAVFGFFLLALTILPAAWMAGRVDRIALPQASAGENSARAATRLALRHPGFLVMACAYFVCGLQLVFLTTHLPSYLNLCGMDPMLGAQALALIGAFNVAGSLFFGWAGGRWPKGVLLGGIYFCRSIILGWYFLLPPTPESTLVFAALMGLLWLGVGPLVSGMVAEMFGLRWQAMIQGFAFFSHQLGSFLGAYGGGVIFDAMGSYDLAWKLGVAMGLTAGVVQILVAWPRHPLGRPPERQRALPA